MMLDGYAVVQLVTAFAGALGFALFFNMNPRFIPAASVAGFLTWALYWMLYQVMGQIFVPCIVASTFAAAFAEVMARTGRVPATAFFIIAVIPLVPGRGLFYTMSGAVNMDWASFAANGSATFLFAAGIACGICIVTACVQTWKYGRAKLAHLQRKGSS